MISIPKSRQRHRRVTADELSRLLDACDPWTKDLVTAALETGCRKGELLSLQLKDVHDDHLVLRAEKTKTKRTRVIPISSTLATIIERRKLGPNGAELGPDAFIFGNEVGERITERLAHQFWAAARDKAKITDLRFHDTRHEFASALLESGAELHHVQAALGHTNLTMTSTYINSTMRGLQNAFKKLHAKRRRDSMRVVGRNLDAAAGKS